MNHEFRPSGCATEVLLREGREGLVAFDVVQVERRSFATWVVLRKWKNRHLGLNEFPDLYTTGPY